MILCHLYKPPAAEEEAAGFLPALTKGSAELGTQFRASPEATLLPYGWALAVVSHIL